ncbi:DUF4194 domain-containing protein [Pseudomonas sp. 273]|uniref:DUF4194 domain-containing protein n=1 Tax=Pseudomonas sp. 273 TaxID=75692 RepID=UPI0023D8511E|nr:DUF4194 domain-containing protein [Pseudomonas sp. 273]
MNSLWLELAGNSDGYYQPEDFESAAYRLMAEQVIYHADRGSRKVYNLIERYERQFAKVLDPFGISLGVDRQLLFAYAIPRHGSPTTATVTQTLFALVLRGIYEDGMRAGQLSDEGAEIFCDFVELREKYQLMTHRELPGKGDLEVLIRTMRRWGIARRLEDEDDIGSLSEAEAGGGGVAIRPAIREVLGESALQQLALWSAERNADSPRNDDVATPADEMEGGDQ